MSSSPTNRMARRRRGVVLTIQGEEKLRGAIGHAAKEDNFGQKLTLEELGDRTGLDPGTVAKVLDCEQGVDRRTCERFFQAFKLELEDTDVCKPDIRQTLQNFSSNNAAALIDWGEKPDTSLFWGRTGELERLNRWVTIERCRLVTILGMGGIGKTSLTAKLADQIHNQFDYVIWRSLREAPPLDEILIRLIQFLSNQQESEINLPIRLGERIIRLLDYLRKHRCLIVLDNLESILQAESTGHFRDGYQDYEELLRRIGEAEHQSCLMLTSRECPRNLAPMAGDRLPVRLLSISGIDAEAGREILKMKGLDAEDVDTQLQELIRRCSGNPQALHLVATAIQREFLGDIDDFLKEEEGAKVEDVRSLLEQHLVRLAPLERSILFWLSINREPVGLKELMEDLLPPITKQEVRSALRGLTDRSLVEIVDKRFTLQNVIMEFATDKFVEQVSRELRTQALDLFHTHALIQSKTKDYVRDTQVRLILKPIAICLDNLIPLVKKSLKTIRHHSNWTDGYVPGNLLNLLCQTQAEVNDVDLSSFTLRQAHLKGMNLYGLNLTNSKFKSVSLSSKFGNVQAVAFSPDKEIFATGDRNGDIQLWQIEGRQKLTTFTEHHHSIHALDFSSDGRFLLSGSGDATSRLWDIQNRRCLYVFREHTDSVWTVAFSPDDKLFASSSDDATIRLWNVQQRKCVHVFSGHTDSVRALTLSPDGRLLISGSNDTTSRLWDVQSGKCLHIFQEHTTSVSSVAFSPDGQLFASSNDATIQLWDIQTLKCLGILGDHTNNVRSLAFNPDGNLLASGSDDTDIRLWNVRQRKCLHVFSGHTNEIKAIAFGPNGRLLISGSEDSTVRLWDVQTSRCLYVFSGHVDEIMSVAFSPDGKFLASSGNDTLVHLWNFQQRRCINSFSGHRNWASFVVFSPNSQLLASCSGDKTIRLWDVHDYQCLHSFEGHIDWGSEAAFSPDGQFLASCSRDKTIRLWNIAQQQCIKVLKGHTDGIGSVIFSPDGQLLVSCDKDNKIWIWDLQKSRCIKTLEGHTNDVRSIVFSPDGQFLASGSMDATVRLWDIRQQQCIHVFEEHTNWVGAVAFSPDGQLLASCSEDKTVRLWDIQNRQCLRVLYGHTNWIWSVAFHPDGQIIASASHDGTIRLWNVQSGECLDVLRVPRPYEGTDITGSTGLTDDQRNSMLALGAIDQRMVNPEDVR